MKYSKSVLLGMLSILLLALPVARVVNANRGDLFLIDFAAYCAVSKALFAGLNPFPDHSELLMLSFGRDVPIVYPGQMLLFALPGYLWGNALQIVYLALNVAIVWFLTGLTLVKACGCKWNDFVRPGARQILFAFCSFIFMSSWSVMNTMRIGQIPVILALCLYGMFWLPRFGFLRPFAFAVIAATKYSLLPVVAPMLFFKGHRKLCIVAFAIFVALSLSPALCGCSLKEVYLGYMQAIPKLFQPDGVNHYCQTGITCCYLGFLKIGILNQILKGVAVIPVLWLFWRERKSSSISDTALLFALSLTMLISYHQLHDYTLVFPLFMIRLFAFAREKNWRFFVVTAFFPAYLAIPGSIIEKAASLVGRIPYLDSVVYLSNPAWNPECRNLFPLTAFYAIALAIWSWYMYIHVDNTFKFELGPSPSKEK